MRARYLIAATALGAIALTACGGGYSNSSSAKPATASPAASAATNAVAVQRGETTLGAVLVAPNGHTLYALTTDSKTNSTCDGACAMAWPPVLVSPGWTAGAGLDRAQFSTIVRRDGSHQLVAGQWPLYTFAGDAKAGDVNGEGSGGVWFAVGDNAKLIKTAPVAASTGGYGY